MNWFSGIRLLAFFKKNRIILVIFIIALLIRLFGVFPGYPSNHPDENLGYGTAIYMYYHYLVPDSFDYGTGRPLFLLMVFNSLFLPLVFIEIAFSQPLIYLEMIFKGAHNLPQYQDLLFGPRSINALYWARYVGATLGALCVPLIFLIGKKLFNKKVGIFAAIFLSFNYRHVLSSVIGVPDAYNAFFLLIAFYFGLLLLEKNTRKRYVLAAIAASVAFSIKYQFFPLIPMVFAHIVWAFRKRSLQYLFNSSVFLSLGIFLVVFLLIEPYVWFNIPQFLKESRYNYLRYQMGIIRFRFYGLFYLFHWGIGEITSFIILFGAIFMLIKERLKFFLLFIFIALFFFVIIFYSNGGIYTRNFSTIIPFLFLFSGYFLWKMQDLLKHMRLGLYLVIILIIFANFVPIINSMKLVYGYSRTWNSSLLTTWLSKMPQNITLRAYPLNLSWADWRDYSRIIVGKHINLSAWDYSKGPNNLAEFQQENVDFAILNTMSFQGMTYWWRQWDAGQLIGYSGVPYDYLENGFYGLSLRELMNYTVVEIYNPWQVADTNNYLVFKIPQRPTNLGREIVDYNFKEESEIWQKRGSLNLLPARTGYLPEFAKEIGGSLAIYGQGGGNTSRLSSSFIPVVAGKTYIVSGWIKNATESGMLNVNVERDGFLRIDFYSNNDNLEEKGVSVALSGRAPMSSEWVLEEAYAQAPKNSRYMTVSFQRDSQVGLFTSYLSNVKIYESDQALQEPFGELPYIIPTISKEDIYYNTFL